MEISRTFLVDLYRFFKGLKPEDEVPVCISHLEHGQNDILSLSINIEHKDKISQNIINLKYSEDNEIIVNKETSIIDDEQLEGKIYGNEKKIYLLFNPESRFFMSACYKPIIDADMVLRYINKDQNFDERYIFKGNKISVKTISEEEFYIEALNQER